MIKRLRHLELGVLNTALVLEPLASLSLESKVGWGKTPTLSAFGCNYLQVIISISNMLALPWKCFRSIFPYTKAIIRYS